MLSDLYHHFWRRLQQTKVGKISDELIALTEKKINDPRQGDLAKWIDAYMNLPDVKPKNIDYSDVIGVSGDIKPEQHSVLKHCLKILSPWRKGPFRLFDIYIDSEWLSDRKWNRILPSLPDLKNKTILDIGCGNGYYMNRMFDHDPSLICGIEPGMLQVMQFWSIEKYTDTKTAVLPIKFEVFPQCGACFDVIFSMGVLYHRQSPLEHLSHIRRLLDKKGCLILETLVIEGNEHMCLVPQGRYAQMRNVWFIPSVSMLLLWLKRMGFNDVECVDVNYTSVEEQRSTEWMCYHSLINFINEKTGKTVEGYPPPLRAVIKAYA